MCFELTIQVEIFINTIYFWLTLVVEIWQLEFKLDLFNWLVPIEIVFFPTKNRYYQISGVIMDEADGDPCFFKMPPFKWNVKIKYNFLVEMELWGLGLLSVVFSHPKKKFPKFGATYFEYFRDQCFFQCNTPIRT